MHLAAGMAGGQGEIQANIVRAQRSLTGGAVEAHGKTSEDTGCGMHVP